MQELIKEIEAAQIKEVTDFNVGDTIKVHAKIVEGNRERIQVFEGLVIKKQGGSNRATFTVRKQSSGIGVERTWPLYSPSIANIEVVRSIPEYKRSGFSLASFFELIKNGQFFFYARNGIYSYLIKLRWLN